MATKNEGVCEHLSEIKHIQKGWGYEIWIENNGLYCGKKLFFFKDKQCSVHAHKIKTETFYIQSGKLQLEYLDPKLLTKDFDDIFSTEYWKTQDSSFEDYAQNWLTDSHVTTLVLEAGDRFFVPPKMFHRMRGLRETEMFEFSTTHYDYDSYRLLIGD